MIDTCVFGSDLIILCCAVSIVESALIFCQPLSSSFFGSLVMSQRHHRVTTQNPKSKRHDLSDEEQRGRGHRQPSSRLPNPSRHAASSSSSTTATSSLKSPVVKPPTTTTTRLASSSKPPSSQSPMVKAPSSSRRASSPPPTSRPSTASDQRPATIRDSDQSYSSSDEELEDYDAEERMFIESGFIDQNDVVSPQSKEIFDQFFGRR